MKATLSLMLLISSMVIFSNEASAKMLTHKRVLISVGDLVHNTNSLWKKETCLQIYTLANQIGEGGTDVTCREFDTKSFNDQALRHLSKSYDFHIRVMKNNEKEIAVDITNWSREHDSDFKSLGWSFKDNANKKDSPVTKEQAFAKTLGNFFYYASNEEAYKAGLLAQGAFESQVIEFDEKKQVFKDSLTGEALSIKRAVSLYENESPRQKNYLRSGIEIGALLSAGMAIYYKNLVYNQQDFDYGFKDGLKKKFNGEAVLFDDNDKFANYGHVYAGVLYYQIARANGFNSLESALINFASSAAWEFLEYHEVFSINDQILTPIGGYIIGEASYQISCALLSKDTIASKTLAYSINPGLGVNHALDGIFKGDKYAAQPDCKKPRWSDISVHIGLEKGQKAYEPKSNNDYVVGMNAEVVNIDNYNKEGKDGKLVYDTAMVKAILEQNGNQGVSDLKVIAQVVMAAYHQKNLTRDEKGQLRGYDIVLGLASASTWHDRGTEEDSVNEDFYGTINVLGANAHANIHYNGYNIRADFGLYGDFAMVKSYSLEPFKASRGGNLDDQAGVVDKRGYYWGVGATALASISIEKGRWEVGYEGQFSKASSINKKHRTNPTSDDTYEDTISTNKIYVSFRISKNFKLQLSQEYNVRTGNVNGSFDTEGVERRTMGTLVYQF